MTAGIGLFVVVGLLSIALSILVNIALVHELKGKDRALYQSLGEPRLIKYDWTALPRNKAYAAWLREVATDSGSRYCGWARLLKILRIVFYISWFSVLVIALVF